MDLIILYTENKDQEYLIKLEKSIKLEDIMKNKGKYKDFIGYK